MRNLAALLLLGLVSAGCAEPADDASTAPYIHHASPPTFEPSGPASFVDVQTKTRNATIDCSLANRWFWFPDETRSCIAQRPEEFLIPEDAVLITVDAVWDAKQPGARNLTLVASDAREDGIEFVRASGPSPLRIVLWERLAKQYYTVGGVLRIDVAAATGLLGPEAEADVAAAAVQDVTITVATEHVRGG